MNALFDGMDGLPLSPNQRKGWNALLARAAAAGAESADTASRQAAAAIAAYLTRQGLDRRTGTRQ